MVESEKHGELAVAHNDQFDETVGVIKSRSNHVIQQTFRGATWEVEDDEVDGRGSIRTGEDGGENMLNISIRNVGVLICLEQFWHIVADYCRLCKRLLKTC